VLVPGRVAEAEALWYEPIRWPSWIDGFGHLVSLGEEWPGAGARRVWDSVPGGRGRVLERVVFHEARTGQRLAVEDARIAGELAVGFAPAGDAVRVTLTLQWRSKQGGALAPLADLLLIRPRVVASLARTLSRFAIEHQADV
jgi:hypothetical protein